MTPLPRSDRGDLTTGPILRKLLSFSLPMIAGNLIFQLYNVTDSVIVGNFVGSDALAAVNASFPIMMLFNALFFGVSIGAGIVVAQTYGAKQHDELQKVIDTAFPLGYLVALLITVAGLLLSKPMLLLLGTPDNILEDSATYLKIIFLGTLPNMGYNLGSGILRGMGDSRWPLIFLSICAAMNVVLDIVFVVIFDMAVAGVAWATILSYLLSAVLVHRRINRGGYPVRFTARKLQWSGAYARAIAKLGLPTAMQNAFMGMGSVFIQSFANTFGSDFIAANSVVMKVDGFAVLPMMAFGMAVSTFVGQNVGAREMERTKKGIEYSILLVIGFGLVLGALLFFLGRFATRAFTGNAAVLSMGAEGLRILAFFYLFMGLNQLLSGAMRGAGAATMPMVATVASTLARIPLAYLMAIRTSDPMGLFWSMAVSMVVNTVIIFWYYKAGGWRSKALVRGKAPA